MSQGFRKIRFTVEWNPPPRGLRVRVKVGQRAGMALASNASLRRLTTGDTSLVRTYSLYIDRVRVDWERRARRTTAVLIIVAHLALMGWLLMLRPPMAVTAPAMVIVELNALASATAALDHRRHGERDATKVKATGSARPNSATRDHDTQTSVDDAARPPVADGRLTAGNDEQTTDALVTAAGTSTSGSAAATAGSRGGAGAGSAGRFVPPRVVSHWLPRYPYDAYTKHVEGDVDVIVTISAEGGLLEAHVDRSSGDAALDAAAVEAVRHYRFRAATKAGEPVEAQAIVGVEWRITEGIKVDLDVTLPRDMRELDARRTMEIVEFLRASPGSHLKD
jgi:TonB family protein